MRSVRHTLLGSQRDAVILLARVLLMVLFAWAGWGKLTSLSGTVGEMARMGLPILDVAAAVVVIIEFFVGIALVVGFCARPPALPMAVCTRARRFVAQ